MRKPTVHSFLGDYVKYDNEGQIFWGMDSRGGMQNVAELRGWGMIQNIFKVNGQHDLKEAAKFQDEIGEFIAAAINEKLERERNP